MLSKIIKKPGVEIFLLSFLILFVELSFIRVFPAQITFLGFYTNFILIASFAGIGLGLLLSKYSFDLRNIFPWSMLVISVFLSIFVMTVAPNTDGKIVIRGMLGFVPEYIAVPFIFLLIVIVFSTISQRLGKIFDKTPPLEAYSWDILGSLSGVVSLAILSFLRTGPVIWFGIVVVVFLLLNWGKKQTKIHMAVFVVVLFLLFVGTNKKGQITRWSPYQKLTLVPTDVGYLLLANNIAHQGVVEDLDKLDFVYSFPYQILSKSDIRKTLIIGSGMGMDVAVALKNGAEEIDAVDIDPEIYRLGLKYDALKPYQNPAVSFFNEDGRSFLSRTDKKYDLIIFAMPDTLFLSAGRGNIRLESFLLTKESFQSAKNHLNVNGSIVVYNIYRQQFIIDKLSESLKEVFGTDTFVLKNGPPLYEAALINGGGLKNLKNDMSQSSSPESKPTVATDDWPFLYMQRPHIPLEYMTVLLIVLVMFYYIVSIVVKKPLYKFLKSNYFFLGVGFFLIETKSIVQFSLLFGATWITNSLVIVAILLSVYLAIQMASRVNISSVRYLYIILFLAFGVQYFFPINLLLGVSLAMRYLVVSMITFTPVFIANVIFSFTFKGSKENSLNFASNMFGAVVGGALEYLALILGYHHLILVIALCYLLAFVSPRENALIN